MPHAQGDVYHTETHNTHTRTHAHTHTHTRTHTHTHTHTHMHVCVCTQADFMPVFATNAVGPFLVTQQLLAQGLLGAAPGGGGGGGRGSLVVNVTSVMASHQDAAVSGATPGAFAYR